MRIAVVTPELHRRRGTERVTSEMIDRLAREHDVHVFAHKFRAEEYPGVTFHRVTVIPAPGLATFLSFYYGARRALRSAERELRAASGAESSARQSAAESGRDGIRLTGRARASMATHPRGFDVVYSPGPNCKGVEVVTAHFCQARQDELLREGRLQPPAAGIGYRLRLAHRKLYARAVARIEREFYRSPELRLVLSPSETLKQDLVRRYGIAPERVRVTPSGVDATGFDPATRLRLRAEARAALGLRDDRFYFLFVGTDWVRKGMMTILPALRETPEAELLAVGPYHPAPYRRAAAASGVAERVQYLPRRSDVIFYYAAADALLSPSIYEPFGLMPLEAMACGLPCIVTRTMGLAEIVSANEALILENGEDPAALADAMRLLMNDAALRQRLVTNGMLLARRHTWEPMYQATLEALIASARAKASR